MAASNGSGNGYSCELFFSPVPEDLKCGLCRQVARRPNISSCCGEHFCEVCINHMFEKGQDCPSCGLDEFSHFADKRVQKKVLALDVRCAMANRGCDWTGKVEYLDSHLDISSGSCPYIDVPCPNSCGLLVQKSELASHLTSNCIERRYACNYCNYTATYDIIVNKHMASCSHYPIPCPNGCRVASIERCNLQDHLNECPLQEIDCEFSYAGCNASLSREQIARHMDENTPRHLLLVSRTLQNKEAEMKQMQEIFAAEQGWMQKQLERSRAATECLEVAVGQLKVEIHLKDVELKSVKEKAAKLEEHLRRNERKIKHIEKKFGVQITVPNFTALLTSRRCWVSTPRCIFPGMHKVYIKVWPNGWQEGTGTHVSVWLNIAMGESAAESEPIADCIITMQLLNQHRDQDHITVKRCFQWNRKHDTVFSATVSNTFVAHTDLDWNIAKQTHYLRNNCLQFKITEFDVQQSS